MSVPFDSRQGLVVVRAEVTGPAGSAVLRPALDTGAGVTLINTAIAVSIGYDPSSVANRLQNTTGSGVEFAPKIEVASVRALGRVQEGFSVVCHTLPPSAGVDGLLGLDFLRDCRLTIDFRSGQIVLN